MQRKLRQLSKKKQVNLEINTYRVLNVDACLQYLLFITGSLCGIVRMVSVQGNKATAQIHFTDLISVINAASDSIRNNELMVYEIIAHI